MKPYLIILATFLMSCNSYNDRMNELLQQKSKIDNILKESDSLSVSYARKSQLVLDGNPFDSTGKLITNKLSTSVGDYEKRVNSIEYKMYSDSIHKYDSISYYNRKFLEQIQYSIDSLSKLK